MNDYLNKEISVGDKVAFIRLHYRELQTAAVTKINPVKLTLSNGTQRHPRDVIVVEKAAAP